MAEDNFYMSPRWLKLRKKILRRDGYMCQYYKRYGRMVPASIVHHIYPVEDYPEYALEPWNLISLSADAHNKMHDRYTGELTSEGKRLMRRTKKPADR